MSDPKGTLLCSVKGADVDKLLGIAKALGLYVTFRPLRRASGYYAHRDRMLILNECDPYATQRVTFAHNLGHAHHGTDCDEGIERDELEADIYAARLLISPDALRAAEVMYGGDTDALADELAATVRLVELRQRDLSPWVVQRSLETWTTSLSAESSHA